MTHTVMRMQTSSKRRSTAQDDSGKERHALGAWKSLMWPCPSTEGLR
jgi:hypothetical protein